ncbi:sensor histidine kinase [Micromonospora sp. NPDC050397]|uniref:sensor histidine kinase n=1 Tax=Micromonospora sp. NPDC050397 TaxID=3364279 RepID=UPI00384D5CF1
MGNTGRPAGTAAIIVSIGLGSVFLAAIVIEAIAIAQSWGARYWLLGGAAAVVVSLLALLRHRQRIWTAVAGVMVAAVAILAARIGHLPAEPGPAIALALSVLIGSAIRALPPVPAGALAFAGFAVALGSHLAARPSSSGAAAVAAINGAGWLAAIVVGLSLRMLDHRARATAEKVRQDERLGLARELHDIVAHHITGMLIQAQAAQIVARKTPAKVTDSLVGIEAAGVDALAAMRRVVGLLRDTEEPAPASPGPEHGPEQLSALVERFNEQGPAVRLRLPDDTTSWPAEVTSTVYRIVQEALTNVSRHAPQARSVVVTVAEDPAGLTVEVVDDAPTATARPHHRAGYGLIGMRERVEALGGTLRPGPRPGAGWSVHATLPLPGREPR